MATIAFVSLPGGSEWLCLLFGLVLMVGFIFLVLYLAKRATAPPPYVPRICQQCHRGNLADALFCSYCGQRLTPPTGGADM